MTTDFGTSTDTGTTTDYESAPGYGEAADAARKAAEGPMTGFLERMAERVGAKASVKAVFGEAIERDGLTIVPVAKVRWGFGGGAGTGPIAVGPGRRSDAGIAGLGSTGEGSVSGSGAADAPAGRDMGSGSGGGGGVAADPVGYLEIGPDGASFKPIVPAMPSPAFLLAAGVTATLVLRGLAKLLRR